MILELIPVNTDYTWTSNICTATGQRTLGRRLITSLENIVWGIKRRYFIILRRIVRVFMLKLYIFTVMILVSFFQLDVD